MKKNLKQLMLLACIVLGFVACTDDSSDNPAKGIDARIVGSWYSDVSGMTYAKWNYGKTWQNTVFNDDGTGSTRIYYTIDDDAIGCEKIDFTYTASADGVLTMTPNDREVMNAKWQLEGDELSLGDGDDISLTFKNCIWQCGWQNGYLYRKGILGDNNEVSDRPQQRARDMHV